MLVRNLQKCIDVRGGRKGKGGRGGGEDEAHGLSLALLINLHTSVSE